MTRGSHGPFHGLRPVLGRAMDRLRLAYVTAEPDEKRRIEMAAELLRMKVGGHRVPLLDPPAKQQADGEVWLGRVLHGEQRLGWAGLDRDRFTTHVGLFGTTGAGKTTASASVLLRLMELGTPWIAIDPKRSLRCLMAMPSPEPVRVVTAGRDIGATLRFNPLALPPGVDPASQIAEMVQLMGDTWHGGVGIASVLEDAMKRAWAANPAPSFADVRTTLEKTGFSGRAAQWVQSALRILKTLTEGRLGKVFAPAAAGDGALDRLMTGWTVIETDGLTREEASFLASSLLLHIHQRLLAQTSRERLRLAVLVDEAEQLLVKRDAQRESLLERMIRVSRESGLSICVASQSVSRMTPTILANIGTLIAMRAHHRDDVSVISRMLMLPEHAVPMLGTLGVGQAVCRVPHWPSPIHIEIPRLQLPKGRVDDAMLERASRPAADRGTILAAVEAAVTGGSTDPAGSAPDRPQPAEQAADRPVPPAESAWSPTREHAGPPHKELQAPGAHEVLDRNPSLRRLLRDVAERPFDPVTRRYTRLDLSRRKGNALRQLLEELGLVKPLAVTTPSGVLTLLELTETARAWLKRTRSAIAPLHGGLLHAYWQHECGRLLGSCGWAVKLEWKPPGTQRVVDVAGWKDGRSMLIEIETGKSSWRANLDHLAGLDVDHRVVLWIGQPDTAKPEAPGGITLISPTKLAATIERLSHAKERATAPRSPCLPPPS